MNIHNLFPSKYVKADDLGGKEVPVQIARCAMERLSAGEGRPEEEKLIVYFRKATKGLVCNRTNAMAIAAAYGPETDAWAGKWIILYAARVKAFGQMHNAVRVKPGGGPSDAPKPAPVEEHPLDDLEDVIDPDGDGSDADIEFVEKRFAASDKPVASSTMRERVQREPAYAG